MSLTLGSGPFARPLAGHLNFDLEAAAPAHVLYLHEVDRRVRGEVAGETVVDTVGARMLHETGLLPQWYLPLSDVSGELVDSDHRTHCPFKGDARYWHLRVGDRVLENVVWSYPDPVRGSPNLSGLGAFYFERLDAWFEEDERVFAHPRDPFHRVDTRRSSRLVRVWAGSLLIAETRRPVALFETGLPVRWYVPREDVASEFLVPAERVTMCPYKGRAGYFDLEAPEVSGAEVAWTYPLPLAEAAAVAGYLCFAGPRVRVEVG
ncbi:DUF427 domain-containing protein [Actinoalloteichus caeruleus]|uniref:Uncharacterized conserved protein, DUF427 family n=1 Tax=Actinoalloteichus caeruleus DSM 43889 TaxID=1120930 RepID=A0ABT1JIY9_ACTCY|nr:DUF427 domain-containing protein [Actinoalloteichus caeruleus]MCP2331706.1 Uncharacterized conserved protein, DUF427 family [Actinoalloteichus caeruleus DSM 43889]